MVGFFFRDRSDTSALHFEYPAMIPEILHLFSPNLEIISTENISIHTGAIRCLLQWLAKHAQNIMIFKSLTKSEQSEQREREKMYCPECSSISPRNHINSDSALMIDSPVVSIIFNLIKFGWDWNLSLCLNLTEIRGGKYLTCEPFDTSCSSSVGSVQDRRTKGHGLHPWLSRFLSKDW